MVMQNNSTPQPHAHSQVIDTEEISQRHRLKEILERRTQLLDIRDSIVEAIEEGQLDYERAVGLYCGKLEGLIIDIYPMFGWATNDDGEQIGIEYLREEQIDIITIHPPDGLRTGVGIGSGRAEPKEVIVTGLEWFLNNDVVITAQFEGYVGDSIMPQRIVNRQAIPLRTVDRGVMAVETFLSEVDVDVQFDDTVEDAVGEYELVGDVPEEFAKRLEDNEVNE